MLVTVALANKTARIVWALLVKAACVEEFRLRRHRPPRPRKREASRRRAMAQRLLRQDQEHQAATPYFQCAPVVWARSANFHTGPRQFAVAQRPDG